MHVAVKITQADDVEPERLHRDEILHRRVERSRGADALGESQVEVIHECLVAGDRLERVVVRECHHRLTRGLGAVGGRVEVDAHLLPRARRRVEEREVLDVLRVFFVLRLTNPEAETVGRVFPVPHVAEVRVDLAREKERVRRREGRERSTFASGHEHPVCRLERHWRVVGDAAKRVVLHVAAGVVPRHARQQIGREPLEARVVLVRNPRLLRLGDGIHANQVGASIGSEAEAARKRSHRQAGERHREAGAVGFHRAGRRLKRRRRRADFRRRSWSAENARR